MNKNKIVWIMPEAGEALEPEEKTPEALLSILYETYELINLLAFNKELPYIKIDFLENGAKGETHKPSAKFKGAFIPCYHLEDGATAPAIKLNNIHEFYGVNDEVINTLYHEMTHFYCYLNNIKDISKEKYHTKAFKKAIEAHRGKCEYYNSYKGYFATWLNDDILNKVFNGLENS